MKSNTHALFCSLICTSCSRYYSRLATITSSLFPSILYESFSIFYLTKCLLPLSIFLSISFFLSFSFFLSLSLSITFFLYISAPSLCLSPLPSISNSLSFSLSLSLSISSFLYISASSLRLLISLSRVLVHTVQHVF